MSSVMKGFLVTFASLFVVSAAYAETSLAGVVVARLGLYGTLSFAGVLLLMIAAHVLFNLRSFWAGTFALLAAVLTLIVFGVALSGIATTFTVCAVAFIATVAASVAFAPFFSRYSFTELSKSDKKMFVRACKVYYVVVAMVPFIVYFRL